MGLLVSFVEQPSDPLGGASGEKRLFNVQFLGKTNTPEFPFTIANEVVAAQIGSMLGLNLPAVLSHKVSEGDEYALITWHERVPLTAARVAQYVADHPNEIHGAIVFDLFVANNDRAFAPERRNLGFDDAERLFLYDQGNACYYRNRPSANIESGAARLDAVAKDLRAMFDMSHKANLYFQLLTEWPLVEMWCERIRQLPDFTIESAVNRIPRFLMRPTPAERSKLMEFLTARKTYLIDHIIRWRECFTGLPERESHA